MNTDIESCSGGVGESLNALHLINAGANSAKNVQDTIKIARYGAYNCSPANNEQLDDLTQYQVTESLAGFHLDTAVNDVITWAFPYAQRVQNDVANELGSHDAAKRQQYSAALQRDTGDLNRQRAAIDKIIMKAITATGARASPAAPGRLTEIRAGGNLSKHGRAPRQREADPCAAGRRRGARGRPGRSGSHRAGPGPAAVPQAGGRRAA